MSGSDHFDRLAEARYRKILESQPQYVWRQFADGEQLRARVFFPKNHDKRHLASSAMFFHGGMWQSTNEVEFVPWALQLAEYGVVSVLPEYRTRQRFDVSASDILDDAREAWLWMYDNALELGLSQRRISLVGSDAGGLMALHAAMSVRTTKRKWFKKVVLNEPQPAAVVLFRGVVNPDTAEARKIIPDMDAETVKKISPVNRLRKGLPILFASHGDQDKLLPWKTTEHFVKQWKRWKNPAAFVQLEGADHTYYHFNVNAAKFEYVLSEWITFMSREQIWQIDDFKGDLLLV